jgi:hypothetical protein
VVGLPEVRGLGRQPPQDGLGLPRAAAAAQDVGERQVDRVRVFGVPRGPAQQAQGLRGAARGGVSLAQRADQPLAALAGAQGGFEALRGAGVSAAVEERYALGARP